MNNVTNYISMVCGLWAILLMSSCAHFYDGTREDLKLAELTIADSVQTFYASRIYDLHENAIEDWNHVTLDSTQVQDVVRMLHSCKPCSYNELEHLKDGLAITGIQKTDANDVFYVGNDRVVRISTESPLIEAAWKIPKSERENVENLISGVKSVTGTQRTWVSYSDEIVCLNYIDLHAIRCFFIGGSQSINISFLVHKNGKWLSVDYKLWINNGSISVVSRSVIPEEGEITKASILELQSRDLPDLNSKLIQDSLINDLLLTKFPNWHKMTNKERMDMLDSCAHEVK